MVDTPTFAPNPYSNFDISQWSNPYSLFKGKALPWPSQYAGTPTDAMGRPIQSFVNAQQQAAQQPTPAPTPGVTLNTNPQQDRYNALTNLMAGQQLQSMLANGGAQPQGFGPVNQNKAANIADLISAQAQLNQPQQQQAAPAAPTGPDMSQAYLQALADPGKVTTPGATVPQSATAYQPGSGVLQQFLANWQPAQGGPGSGFQQGFNRALRGT